MSSELTINLRILDNAGEDSDHEEIQNFAAEHDGSLKRQLDVCPHLDIFFQILEPRPPPTQ